MAAMPEVIVRKCSDDKVSFKHLVKIDLNGKVLTKISQV